MRVAVYYILHKLFPSSIIPVCALEYDAWNGDYGCGYGCEEDCEYCLCNYNVGGRLNPITRKQANEHVLWLLYGKQLGYQSKDSTTIDCLFLKK